MTQNFVKFPFRLMYVRTDADGTHTGYEVPVITREVAHMIGVGTLEKYPDIKTMYIVELDKNGDAVSGDFEFLAGGI